MVFPECRKKNMKMTTRNFIGYCLMLVGLLVMAFSKQIAFPCLERVLGIQTMVGKENVVFQPDGSYYFTNPRAVMLWVLAVVTIGLFIHIIGIWLSGIRVKFPPKRVDEK
jgi:hypothetical protein